MLAILLETYVCFIAVSVDTFFFDEKYGLKQLSTTSFRGLVFSSEKVCKLSLITWRGDFFIFINSIFCEGFHESLEFLLPFRPITSFINVYCAMNGLNYIHVFSLVVTSMFSVHA